MDQPTPAAESSHPAGLLARIFPRDGRRRFVRFVLHNLPASLIVMAAMYGMEKAGWLKGFETFGLDALVLSKVERRGLNIVVVKIDDTDYKKLFGGRSPLDPDQLTKLLTAVEAGGPRLVAVDLDTSDHSFEKLKFPDVVWARDAEPLCPGPESAAVAGAESQPSTNPGAEETEEEAGEPTADDCQQEVEDVLRKPFLGGNFSERLEDGFAITTTPPAGVPLFLLDPDGVVRRYQRTFESTAAKPPSPIKGRVDSLAWAIARKYRDLLPTDGSAAFERGNIKAIEDAQAAAHGGGHSDEVVLNYSYDRAHFKHISARHLLKAAEQRFWADKALVRGAIVLIGGGYRTDRDQYLTPVGRRLGVELVAQAVEADVLHRGISEVNHTLAWLLDIVNSIVLMYVNWRWPSRRTFLLSMVMVIVLSLGGSFLAFRAFAYWFNFSAVLLGLWLHMLYEGSAERRELRREVDHLKQQLAARA
jgi:CHASE2 domain-containing sensor protein